MLCKLFLLWIHFDSLYHHVASFGTVVRLSIAVIFFLSLSPFFLHSQAISTSASLYLIPFYSQSSSILHISLPLSCSFPPLSPITLSCYNHLRCTRRFLNKQLNDRERKERIEKYCVRNLTNTFSRLYTLLRAYSTEVFPSISLHSFFSLSFSSPCQSFSPLLVQHFLLPWAWIANMMVRSTKTYNLHTLTRYLAAVIWVHDFSRKHSKFIMMYGCNAYEMVE